MSAFYETVSQSSSVIASFESETRIHVFLLRIIGMVAFKNQPLNFVYSKLLSLWFHLSYSFFTAMYLYSFFKNCLISHYNIEQISETIILLGSHSRFLILHYHRTKLATLLKMSETLWFDLETKEIKTVTQFIFKSKVVVYAYLGACFLMCTFYIIMSQLLLPSTHDQNSTRSLPFDFFVEVQTTPWFEIVLTLQGLTMFGLAITSNGIDTSGPFFIMMACGHLRALSYRTQRCSTKILKKNYKTKDFAKTIISYIKYHQAILKYCYQIQTVMGGIFVTQLISTTYNMALLGLKVVGEDPDKSKYATLIVVLLIQLLFLQWAPDMLINESKAVANDSYLVPSFGYENRYVNQLLYIFIMRSQRPIELRAAGYVKLSMESFGKMITDILSFFAVLRNLN